MSNKWRPDLVLGVDVLAPEGYGEIIGGTAPPNVHVLFTPAPQPGKTWELSLNTNHHVTS